MRLYRIQQREPAELDVTLLFTDAAGVFWHRSEHGLLREVDRRESARIYDTAMRMPRAKGAPDKIR